MVGRLQRRRALPRYLSPLGAGYGLQWFGDVAILDAYGWPAELADDDLLARLLTLNLAGTVRPPGCYGVSAP